MIYSVHIGMLRDLPKTRAYTNFVLLLDCFLVVVSQLRHRLDNENRKISLHTLFHISSSRLSLANSAGANGP